ncbi:hypothetical protein QJS04_geneDACA018872 [Acorus gramineus]|uniref:Uncharacterized protein n=1 Tax=Acorus gramineus TaxID=55184 RepID=A0AAV9BTE1_ACOGR|nr:hypothetical protein QJS04_geneDACA018872 [Acorus gramineus]
MGKKKGTSSVASYERLLESGNEKKAKDVEVPSGYVPMMVGSGREEEMERFMVHTELFKHPCIVILLEMAAEEFGYEQQGILKIPCDVEHFRSVIAFELKRKKKKNSR